jgi:hypothetical protein
MPFSGTSNTRLGCPVSTENGVRGMIQTDIPGKNQVRLQVLLDSPKGTFR